MRTLRNKAFVTTGLVLFGLVLAVSVASGASRTGKAASPIVLGVDVAQTGYLASNDLPFVKGVRLAVAAINKKGGINGHQFKADVLDDASTASTGVSNAQQLISQNQVNVLLGGSLSAQCFAVASIAAAASTPMTCISAIPAGAPWAFQVSASLPSMINDEVNFALSSLKAKNVAFLYSQTPYGQAASGILQGLVAKDGFNLVVNDGIDPNLADMTAEMAKVKAANPDVVLDFLTGPVHLVEAKGAAAVNLGVPIVQGTDTTNIFHLSTEAYPNLYFIALPPQQYPQIKDKALLKTNAAFYKAYKPTTKNPLSIAQAAYGWDAVNLVALAVKVSGATNGEPFRSTIENLNFQGVLSRFRFSSTDHTGEVIPANPTAIGQWKNNKVNIVYWAS